MEKITTFRISLERFGGGRTNWELVLELVVLSVLPAAEQICFTV